MKRATTGPPGEKEDFLEVSYSGYPGVFGEPRIWETSGFEPNRQLVGAFQNGTAPSAISFRACYKKSKTSSEVSGARLCRWCFQNFGIKSGDPVFYSMGPQLAV